MRHCIVASRIFAIFLFLGVMASSRANAEPRPALSLDGSWSFRMDPNNVGEQEQWFAPPDSFADSIRVPGAWEAQGFGAETEKLRHHFIGKGWYKRRVDIPSDWSGRRVFICFGGAHRYASVWVNGKSFGEHIGGLSPFEFDITEAAPPGSSALIVVRVDSEQRWDLDTMLGAWDIIDYMDTYWGGLWGHVGLEARNAAHLENLFVEPDVAPPRCRVSADLNGAAPDGAFLRLEILDRDKNVVATASAPKDSPLGAISLEAPSASLWTPDSPALYFARLTLTCQSGDIDSIETRFGFKKISIEGTRFLLNGQPLFLRGYGDDAIYPETVAAPSDEAWYRKKIAIAKQCGFNHVRHHSHFLPPEYYDVCDELGMLVSPELPIGYQPFYDRAKGPALDLYKSEWSAVIRRFRNHPSIFDWCMGNEMYESVPIAPDLYRIAKSLDSTRPVVDTDGLPTAGFFDGTRDRDTLDFYFMQFDVWNCPLDNPNLYACPTPKKPVLAHEAGNYVTFPRLDQIELFKDDFIPFWLNQTREKVRAMGLMDETPRWAENTEKLYVALHKSNVEAIRKSPNLSGYHWWLLQDYWTTSNGIVDTYLRFKPGVDVNKIRQFNNDVVLLEDGLARTYRTGDHAKTKLFVSNFGPAPIQNAELACHILLDKEEIASLRPLAPNAPQGVLTQLAEIDIPSPKVDEPKLLTFKVELKFGERTFTNEWTAWLFPERISSPSLPVYTSPELLSWLSKQGARQVPSEKPYPVDAVYVSDILTPELVDAVTAGATLLLYKPQNLLPSAPTRYKSAWWLGNMGDNNAGVVVYDNPATRPIAPEGWCDISWRNLLEGSEGYILDNAPFNPDVIIRGVEVACVCRNKSMLFQGAVGKGSLIACGLNLDAVDENGAPLPEAEWLTSSLINYAATHPACKAAIPEKILRDRVVTAPDISGPLAEGFATLIKNEGESDKWFTYRKSSDRTETLRQKEEGRSIEWETAPAPEFGSDDTVTFVFAGGLGWRSQPEAKGFSLAINGVETLRFDVSLKRSVWRDDSGKVSLSMIPRSSTTEDAAGLFYLTTPKEMITPGKPLRLRVTSLGADSMRWFSLHPYNDVLGKK